MRPKIHVAAGNPAAVEGSSSDNTPGHKRSRWWGPSHSVLDRFGSSVGIGRLLKKADTSNPEPQPVAAPAKISLPLVEALEPRILLSADLTPFLTTLDNGLDDLTDFLEDLEQLSELAAPLPVLGTAIDEVVDLSDMVSGIVADVDDLLNDPGALSGMTVDAIEAELGAVSSTFVEGDQITFTFNLSDSGNVNLPLLLDGVGGLELGSNVDLTVGADFTLTIGVDLSGGGAGEFFVQFGDVTATATATAPDIDAVLSLGGVDATITDGTFNLDATAVLSITDPGGDGSWSIEELRSITAENAGDVVSVATSGSLDASLPIAFASGSIASSQFIDATLIASVDNPFDGLGESGLTLESTISADFEATLLSLLSDADAALASAQTELDGLLASDVPLLGVTVGDLLGGGGLPTLGASLETIATDYFAGAGASPTLTGLFDALTTELQAAGSNLIPVFDAATNSITFDLSYDTDVSLSALGIDLADLGIDEVTGGANLSGAVTLAVDLGFAIDLDAASGAGFSINEAGLNITGDLTLADLTATLAFAGLSAGITSGSGTIALSSKLTLRDSNGDGTLSGGELTAPELSADASLDLTMTADVSTPIGDLGDVANLSVNVSGDVSLDGDAVTSDLNVEVDFELGTDLQTTIFDLFTELDGWLDSGADTIGAAFNQQVPVIGLTVGELLGLGTGDSVLPDISLATVANDYFGSTGTPTLEGLLDALSTALGSAGAAITPVFNPDTLTIEFNLNLSKDIESLGQTFATSGLGLGDVSDAVAASGTYDLVGALNIEFGFGLSLDTDSGVAAFVSGVEVGAELEVSIADLTVTGSIGGIGGGVVGGSARVQISGSVSVDDANGDGVLDSSELSQPARDISIEVDARLPIETVGIDVLGADGLVAPILTVHADNILDAFTDSDAISYDLDFIIGSNLESGILQVLETLETALNTALSGIEGILGTSIPGIGTVGDLLGMTADDLAQAAVDLDGAYQTLIDAGGEVTLNQLKAALNVELSGLLGGAGEAVDGLLSVDLDVENQSLSFDLNIDEVLGTIVVDLGSGAFDDLLPGLSGITDLSGTITPSLEVSLQASLSLANPGLVSVEAWSAELTIDLVLDASADALTVGPFGATIAGGDLQFVLSASAAALGANEGTATLLPAGPTTVEGDLGADSGIAAADYVGTYGSVTVGDDGSWSYAVDPANADIITLPATGTLTDTIDLAGIESISITINGADVIPEVAGDTEYSAVIAGDLIIDGSIAGLGSAVTLILGVTSDNLITDPDSIDGSLDIALGADLADWVIDQLATLDDALADGLDAIDDILNEMVPGIDKPLGEILGIGDFDGVNYSLSMPFDLSDLVQDYLGSFTGDGVNAGDLGDEIATIRGLFTYVADQISAATDAVGLFFNPDDFSFQFDLSLSLDGMFAESLSFDSSSFGIDLAGFSGLSASADATAAGELALNLGFGVDFSGAADTSNGDTPDFYLTQLDVSGDLELSLENIEVIGSIEPFGGGIEGGTAAASVSFTGIIDADANGDGIMTLSELGAGGIFNYTLAADLTASLPILLGGLAELGKPIILLDARFEVVDGVTDTDASFDVDFELGTAMEDALMSLLTALDDLLNGAADVIEGGLLGEAVPGTGLTVGELLGVDGINLRIGLKAAAQDYLDNLDVSAEPTILGLLDAIVASGALGDAASLIPNFSADGLMIDLSFTTTIAGSASFDLSTADLGSGLLTNLDSKIGASGDVFFDLTFDVNLGLGLDLTTLTNPTPYLYLPDAGDPLASISATGGIEGLDFTMDVAGFGSAGVVGGEAIIELGLSLPAPGGTALDDGILTLDELTSATWGFETTASLEFTLPLQLTVGGSGFSLATATGGDSDLTDGISIDWDVSSNIGVNTLFENPELMFLAVDLVLAGLEEVIQSEVLDKLDIPLIGDGLKDGGNFIEGLREKIADIVDALAGLERIDLANILAKELNGVFPGDTGTFTLKLFMDAGAPIELDGSDLTTEQRDIFAAGGDIVGFEVIFDLHLDLIEDLGLDAIDLIPLNFDIGFEFLSLSSNALLDIDIELDIKLGLGISDADGLYIAYDENDAEFQLSLDAHLVGEDGDPARLELAVGPLSFIATDNALAGGVWTKDGSGLQGTLFFDIQNADGSGGPADGSIDLTSKYTLEELFDAGADAFDVGADLNVYVDLIVETDMPAAMPSISLNLVLGNKDENEVSFTLSDGAIISGIDLAFLDVSLDLGSFFSNMLGPLLEGVQTALEPIAPILDILDDPLPIISDFSGQDVTLIDLAEFIINSTGKGKVDLSLVKAVVAIANLIVEFPTNTDGLTISFGDFTFENFLDGSGSTQSKIDASAAANGSGSVSAADRVGSSGSSPSDTSKKKSAGGFLDNLGGIEGLSVPLLTNPSSILGLLMGEVVDLIVYDMPELVLEFEYRKDFLVVPQFAIWAGFFGEVSLSVDFTFGFDTYGIELFKKSGNALDIPKGLYIADWDFDAAFPENDVNEIEFDVSIGVKGFGGLPGLVELGVKGGLFGFIDFDLNDPGFTLEGGTGEPDGKIHLDELIDRLSRGPHCIFDVTGGLDARLSAFFWLGVDLGFLGEITIVDWEAVLFSINILSFEFSCTLEPPILAQGAGGFDTSVVFQDGLAAYAIADAPAGGELFLNMGDRAGDRLRGDTSDGDEEFFVTEVDIDGVRYLAIAFDGVPFVQQDPNNNERAIPVYFRADQVTKITANGGNGNDVIMIDGEVSSHIELELSGGAGDDQIIVVGGGSATIHGGDGEDLLVGGAFNDTIYGDQGRDSIDGGEGDDTIYGGSNAAGADSLSPNYRVEDGSIQQLVDGAWVNVKGYSHDTIMGGAGNDTIYGSSLDDRIIGADGDDTIFGNAGNDRIRGGEGVDTIDAGAGNDIITWLFGDGNDASVTGGSGDDSLDVTASELADIIRLGQGTTTDARLTIGASVLDFDSIEGINLNAGTGADNITIDELSGTVIRDVTVNMGENMGTERRTFGILVDGDGLKTPTDFGIAGSADALAAIDAAIADGFTVESLTDQTIDVTGNDGAADLLTLNGLSGAAADVFVLQTLEEETNPSLGTFIEITKSGGAASYIIRVVNSERGSTTDSLVINSGDGDDVIDASGIQDLINPDDGTVDSIGDLLALTINAGIGNDILIGSDFADVLNSGLGDDRVTGGTGVDTFIDAGGNDTLVEQFNKDISLSDNALIVGDLSDITRGDTNFERLAPTEDVSFEKLVNHTLEGRTDVFDGGAEVEIFESGLFENAEISGGNSNNTLVVGDDDGIITVGGVDVAVDDWTGSVILDNQENTENAEPEYYVIRNSGGLTGTIEIRDTGAVGSDELLIDLERPTLADNDPGQDQSLTLWMDGNLEDGTARGMITGTLGFAATIIYDTGINKLTLQMGEGDDIVVANDVLIRAAIDLGGGDDTIVVGEVTTTETSDGIEYVSSHTLGNHDEMVVFGGDGNDLFDVHYNRNTLHLYGENDDDTFTLTSYLVLVEDLDDITGDTTFLGGSGDDAADRPPAELAGDPDDRFDYLQNGRVFIDGGEGFDRLGIVGTDIGDTVIVTENFVAGMGRYTEFANLEGLVIRTRGGDDNIHILSLDADMVVDIKAGEGNDHIQLGGNAEPIKNAPFAYDQPGEPTVQVGEFGDQIFGDFFNYTAYELAIDPDQVTIRPPGHWIWLGPDNDMSDILGDVNIEGDTGDDTVSLFNSDGTVTSGLIESVNIADEGDPAEYVLNLTGFSGGSITVTEAVDLNIYLGAGADTVTFDVRDAIGTVDHTTLYTGGGNDEIFVEAITSQTNVYAGAGDDTIHVGDGLADAIGDTLVIDGNRDYAIATLDVTDIFGDPIFVEVAELTADTNVLLLESVQLTNQDGWFVDPTTGEKFYLPIGSGRFATTVDGAVVYLPPSDYLPSVDASLALPLYFDINGTHTTDLTSLWLPAGAPEGYVDGLRIGHTASGAGSRFFLTEANLTNWISGVYQAGSGSFSSDDFLLFHRHIFEHDIVFGVNRTAGSLEAGNSTASYSLTGFTHRHESYYTFGGHFLGGRTFFSSSFSANVNVSLEGFYYNIKVGAGESDHIRYFGVMDNIALEVMQVATTPTIVTYDVIDGNVQVAGNDTIIVHDDADDTDDTGTLTETAIYGLDMGGHVEYTNVEHLVIDLGSGNDQFDIIGTNATTVTDINGNDGDDILTVSGPAAGSVAVGHTAPVTADEHDGSLDAIEGALNLDAGGGMNTLIVDDGGDPDADDNVLITDDTITGLAPATITYTATGGSYEAVLGDPGADPEFRIRLYGGTGGNTIEIANTRNGADEYTLLNAGLGDDTVTITEGDPTHLIVRGETGDDLIDARLANGGHFGLHLHGNEGDDIIYGGGGDDFITGDLGNDLLLGNGGDDLMFGDTALNIWNGLALESAAVIETGSDGEDHVEGNGGNDTIYGNGGNDDLIGGSMVAGAADGDDRIDGGSGRDLIAGDNALISRDAADGLPGVDLRFRASLNGDLLYGADGLPLLSGASYDDPTGANGRYIQLLDGAGSDIVAGGADGDWIFAQAGDDIVEGDSALATDAATSGVSADDAAGTGRDGDDYIEGGAGDDTLYGNLGQDDLIGGSSNLFGETNRSDGSDVIFGGSNTHAGRYDDGDIGTDGHARDADVIIGDNGNIFRMVDAATGQPLVYSFDPGSLKVLPRVVWALDYTLGGDAGDIGAADIIHGEGGDDLIYGLTGDDILYGDGQNDDIVGGAGADRIFGGNGVDGLIGDEGQVLTQMNGVAETQFGLEAGATDVLLKMPGDRVGILTSKSGELTKSVHLFAIDLGGNDIIFGGLGNDFIHGGAGDDALSGAEALPEFFDPAGAALLSAPVYDPLTRQLEGYDPDAPLGKVDGFLLNHDVNDNDGDDAIFGDDGNDWLVGGTGADMLFGGRGDDVLNADDNPDTDGGANTSEDTDARYAMRDFVYGGAGLDVLIGNSKSDQLIDWFGEFNSFIVPFKVFGLPTVIRIPSPQVQDYVLALGTAAGADTSYTEPFGELGLFTQSDADARDNVGAPRDPQPGNNAGGNTTLTAATTTTTTTSTTSTTDTGGTITLAATVEPDATTTTEATSTGDTTTTSGDAGGTGTSSTADTTTTFSFSADGMDWTLVDVDVSGDADTVTGDPVLDEILVETVIVASASDGKSNASGKSKRK